MEPQVAGSKALCASLDIGAGVVENPVLTPPNFPGVLPDFVDIRRIITSTAPADPPSASQVNNHDTSARSLAQWTQQDLSSAALAIADAAYHRAWPNDAAHLALLDEARRSAPTIIGNAVWAERSRDTRDDVSFFVKAFFPLAAVWTWFGFGLGIDFAKEWLGVIVSFGAAMIGWLLIDILVTLLDNALPRRRRVRHSVQVVTILALVGAIISGWAQASKLGIRSWTMTL